MFQLLKLSKQLRAIWTENKGFVVLYSWAQFLKDECLSFLKLEKSLDVSAVEEAQRRYIERCKAMGPKRREALSGISTKREENVKEEVESGSKPAEEVCRVVDVSSVCDNLREEQARLVKLSLYDSGQTESTDKAPFDEASGSGEIDLSKMIAFDKDVEVKRLLYSSGPEEGTPATEVSKEDLEKPGPSRGRQHNSSRFGLRRNLRSKKGKPLTRGGGRFRGKVLSQPLAEPLWNIIVDYNKMRRRKDFEYQMFCCPVCFEVSM